jgi:hypothetical protein
MMRTVDVVISVMLVVVFCSAEIGGMVSDSIRWSGVVV